jgi:hypothetical protein
MTTYYHMSSRVCKADVQDFATPSPWYEALACSCVAQLLRDYMRCHHKQTPANVTPAELNRMTSV